MASDLSFAEYVRDQLAGAGSITFKKMFGEYAVYCDGKVVALVGGNMLFIKPTSAGRALLGQVVEAPPYLGAKPYFRIDDLLDDQQAMANLVRVTAAQLPVPVPKKRRTSVK